MVTVYLDPHSMNILKMEKNQAQARFNKVIRIATKGWSDKSDNILKIKMDVFKDIDTVTGSIIGYATKNKIDLIVIGTKGRTGLKRILLGSVALGVVQQAYCPVLVNR